MGDKSWPTEPLIVIAKGLIFGAGKDREIENGSLAVRDPADGWYWSTDGGWLAPERAEITEYASVIPVSLDGSMSVTWFTQYAPEEFSKGLLSAKKEDDTSKYKKAVDFIATWYGPTLDEDIPAVDFIAELDLDDDTDVLKLAASAYCGSDSTASEIAEKATEVNDIDRAELLKFAFKVDSANNALDAGRACSKLAAAAMARWGAMQ